MLKKIFRLPKINFKAEKIFNLQGVALKISKNNLRVSRFGFVVSKKVDKRATVRNRTKRALRSFVQDNFKKIKPGFDFLFIAKSSPDENTKIKEVLKKEGYLE